jgi:hypothetical protein
VQRLPYGGNIRFREYVLLRSCDHSGAYGTSPVTCERAVLPYCKAGSAGCRTPSRRWPGRA